MLFLILNIRVRASSHEIPVVSFRMKPVHFLQLHQLVDLLFVVVVSLDSAASEVDI